MKDSKYYILFETLVLSIITLPLYYVLFMANADLFFPFNNSDVSDYSNLYLTVIGIIPIIFLTKHLAKKWIYNLLLKKELLLNSFIYLIPIIVFHLFFYRNFIGYELRLGAYFQKEIIHRPRRNY